MNYASASECDNCDDGFNLTRTTCNNCATSLIEAVRSEYIECVRQIIEHGIADGQTFDVNEIESASGNTALHEAVYSENSEIVRMLAGVDGLDLNPGGNRNGADHGSPLYRAAYENLESMVLLLIELGADANYHNERHGGGQTILRTVAYAGFTNLVQPLIDAGADVNKLNVNGHRVKR